MTATSLQKSLPRLLGSSAVLLAAVALGRTSTAQAEGDIAEIQVAQAAAQTQASSAEDEAKKKAEEGGKEEIEEVVVTGSRIRRSNLESPAPLTIIDDEAVKLSGENNLADFLSEVPALSGSLTPDQQTGASLGLAGLNLLNLRDLGTKRTLVLVNGRRHVAGDPGTTSVDIGTIPFALVERVEVITGGASAIYGADAVSGVVNFIIRDDYQGFQLDAEYFPQDNRGSAGDGYRFSAVAGGNFADGKGNATLAIEWRETNGLDETDIDFFRKNRGVIRVDRDVDTDGDGILDPDGIAPFQEFNNLGSLQVSDGGNLINFINNDIYRFFADGFRQADTGPLGILGDPPRFTVQGGDGFPFNEFTGGLTPDSQSLVINAFVNYQLTDWAELYMEGKYADTQANFLFQPSFSLFILQPTAAAPGELVPSPIFGDFGFDAAVGIDNPFLPADARNFIAGLPFPAALDIRFNFDLGERGQIDDRQTARIVTGVRGNFDVGEMFHDWQYDASFTYGRTTVAQKQTGIPILPRLFASMDAIAADSAILSVLNSDDKLFRISTGQVVLARDAQPGDVVCRALAMERAGQDSGFDSFAYEGCIPTSVFGPNAINPAARDWITAEILESDSVEQADAMFTLTGDLWDLWGAGPIGFAAGYEFRTERAQVNNDALPLIIDTFANAQTGVGGKFHVHEGFFEFNVPLLKDMFLAEELSVGGAARFSNYSTAVGSTTTWGVNATYRPVQDIRFRGTLSRSIRAPNISELFQPLTQTFSSIADPCSAENVDADPNFAANRRQNCAALGIPVGVYRDPRPNITKAGSIGGNPNLRPETAKSWTVGTIITPRWVTGFSLAVDWFKIQIFDAISFLSAQTIANKCVDGPTLDPQFCSLITRAPASASNAFEIVNFVSTQLNVEALSTRGADFDARYVTSVDDLVGRDWGDLLFRVRGTYLDSWKRFAFQGNRDDFDQFAGLVGLPKWHFQFTTSWAWKKWSLTYSFEWQNSQRSGAFEKRDIAREPDLLLSKKVLTTGGYGIHDISMTYDIRDNLQFRAGVNNIADNDPPAIAERATTFDNIGRRYFVGLTFTR